MPQVIKHGAFYREPKKVIPLDRRKYTLVCKNCGCKFFFMGSETQFVGVLPSMTDFNKLYHICSIDCPECGTKDGFDLDEIPFEEVKEE